MSIADHPAGLQVTGRRRRSRLRVRLSARLLLIGETRQCILKDLSLTGAQVLLARPVAAGASALLQWGDFEAFGLVSWATGKACGLCFDEPIAAADLIATRDLNDVARLPPDYQLRSEAAREWAQGMVPR